MTQGSPASDPLVADATKPYVLKEGWEIMCDSNSLRTSRVAVAGGWVVEQHRRDLVGSCPSHALSICFVPDENHYWKITDGQ